MLRHFKFLVFVFVFVTSCSSTTPRISPQPSPSTPTDITDSKPEAPITVRLDGVVISGEQVEIKAFVQPQVDSPTTYITLTLPTGIVATQGNLNWKRYLKAGEVFTNTTRIASSKINSLLSVQLEVLCLQTDSVFSKTEHLYLRPGTKGGIEISNDYYFGAGPSTTESLLAVTATYGYRAITNTPGIPKPPPTNTPTPTLTSTPIVAPTSISTAYP